MSRSRGTLPLAGPQGSNLSRSLLPPRSAPRAPPPPLARRASARPGRSSLLEETSLRSAPSAGFGARAHPSSIFGAGPLGRYVVTRFLEDFDFHDHLPAVRMDRRPFGSARVGPPPPASGSFRIAISAYQKWPTIGTPSRPAAPSGGRGPGPVRSSAVVRGACAPREPPSDALPCPTVNVPMLS